MCDCITEERFRTTGSGVAFVVSNVVAGSGSSRIGIILRNQDLCPLQLQRKVKLCYFPESSNLVSKILKIMTHGTTLMREIKQCELTFMGIKVSYKLNWMCKTWDRISEQ
jgi:hypothetical protein